MNIGWRSIEVSLVFAWGVALTSFGAEDPAKFTVKFKPNGGLGAEMPLDYEVGVSKALPDAAEFGYSYEGYSFAGWATNSYGSVAYRSGADVTNLTAAAGTVSLLYAVWEGNRYTIEFRPNGDKNDVVPSGSYVQTNFYDTAFNLVPNRFICLGYEFQGWTEKASGSVKYKDGARLDGKQFGMIPAGGTNIVLYAQWFPKKAVVSREVTKSANYEVNPAGDAEIVFHGKLSAENVHVFTVKTTASGTYRVSVDPYYGARQGVTLTVGAENGVPVTVTDFDSESTNFVFAAGSNYVFTVAYPNMPGGAEYAYVVGINREATDVLYDANGGMFTGGTGWKGSNQVFTVGTPYGYFPQVVAPEGGVFVGWYTNKTGGAELVQDDLVVRDGHLYARWDFGPYSYRVEFYKNHDKADGIMSPVTFRSDEKPCLPENTFKRTGRTFEGWARSDKATAAEFSDKEQIITPLALSSNETVKLYAVWSGYSQIDPLEEEDESRGYRDANGVYWHYIYEEDVGIIISNRDEDDNMKPAVSIALSGAVTIPSTIHGYPVVGIDAKALEGCTRITSVTIPATVTTIGERAFCDCTSLESVDFASDHTLRNISECCFAGCTALSSIEIPYSVLEIGSRAFADCASIGTGITIPENVNTLGSRIFENCKDLKVVRFLGEEPEEVEQDVYEGTSESLLSIVRRTTGSWGLGGDGYDLPAEWNGRRLDAWATAPAVCRVTWGEEGGADDMGSEFRVKGHALVTLPEPDERADETKDGYTIHREFDGWFTAKTGGSRVTAKTYVRAPVKYYGRWIAEVEPETTADTESAFWPPDVYCSPDAENGGDVPDPVSMKTGAIYDAFAYGEDSIGFETPTIRSVLKFAVGKGVVEDGVTNSSVTATVVQNGLTKTYSGTMKNGRDVTLSPASGYDDAGTMTLLFTSNGVAGVWGERGVVVQGARNGMGNTRDGMYADLEKAYKGRWTIVFSAPSYIDEKDSESCKLSLDIGAKGVVKVSGVCGDHSFSTSSQLIVGRSDENTRFAVVPVLHVLPKNGGTVALAVRLNYQPDDDAVEVGVSGTRTMPTGETVPVEVDEGNTGRTAEPEFDEKAFEDSVNACVGVAYRSKVGVNTLGGAVKYTAKNLPAGLKLDAATGVISGVPTKACTNKVTLTATSTANAGWKAAHDEMTIAIAPLPPWAKGTFNGIVSTFYDEGSAAEGTRPSGDSGTVTMTVSAAGKISGKIVLGGTNWTFSATGYDAGSDAGAGEFKVVATASVGRNVLRSLVLKVTNPEAGGSWSGGNGAVAGAFGEYASGVTDYAVTMCRNFWGDKAAAAEMKDKSGALETKGALRAAFNGGLYTVRLAPGDSTFDYRDDAADEYDSDAEIREGFGYGYLSLSTDAKGNVKATGKAPDGTALSGSAVLEYDPEGGCSVRLLFRPASYKGGTVYLPLTFGHVFDGGRNVGVTVSVAGRKSADPGSKPYFRSLNPCATAEYGRGVFRGFDPEGTFGAYYDRKANLTDYYRSAYAFSTGDDDLPMVVDAETFHDDSEMDCWKDLHVALNGKGTAFVVQDGDGNTAKPTSPVKSSDEECGYLYEGANDVQLSFSFAKATGVFKGSFTLWYDYVNGTTSGKWTHTSKKVKFEGISVRSHEGDTGGSLSMDGLWLWPKTGSYVDDKGKSRTYKFSDSYPVMFSDEW